MEGSVLEGVGRERGQTGESLESEPPLCYVGQPAWRPACPTRRPASPRLLGLFLLSPLREGRQTAAPQYDHLRVGHTLYEQFRRGESKHSS